MSKVEDKQIVESLNIGYTFEKEILVKPLPTIMVEKVVVKQIPTGEQDEEGNNLYETKEEKESVESNFETGVVLALPTVYTGSITVGDTVVYNKKFAIDFDLYKTSKLVKPYDIIAIVTK